MARSIKRQSKLWMDSRAGALRRLPENVFSRIEFKCNVRTILLEQANKSRVLRVRNTVKFSAIRAKINKFLRDRQKNGESNKVSIMLFATQS